jgi:hypothetical protein
MPLCTTYYGDGVDVVMAPDGSEQADVPLCVCSTLDVVYGDMSHRGSCLKHGNFNCEPAEQHLTVWLVCNSTARVIHLFKTQLNENIHEYTRIHEYWNLQVCKWFS